MAKTFWFDERLAQSVLEILSEKPAQTEDVAKRLALDPVDALSMLREMSEAGRVLDVTDFADRAAGRRMWVAGETPLTS